MKTPHKHAELIKAWADGEEIQWRSDYSTDWETTSSPSWARHIEYRIKPEPKPDVVRYATTWFSAVEDDHLLSQMLTSTRTSSDNIKLTFDGETNKLIKAEVI